MACFGPVLRSLLISNETGARHQYIAHIRSDGCEWIRKHLFNSHNPPKMTSFYANNLETCTASEQLCKAFGIKISPNAQVVQIARNAGFDSLFIDLEHAWLTPGEASNLCNVGHLCGITPFVRVPHQCGNGYVHRVLDGGAMGIIFPHIHNAGT